MVQSLRKNATEQVQGLRIEIDFLESQRRTDYFAKRITKAVIEMGEEDSDHIDKVDTSVSESTANDTTAR